MFHSYIKIWGPVAQASIIAEALKSSQTIMNYNALCMYIVKISGHLCILVGQLYGYYSDSISLYEE